MFFQNCPAEYARSPTESSGFGGFDSGRLSASKGWEFSCPYNFIGGLPESFTQGLLAGKLLVGGLGVSQGSMIAG